MANLSNRYARLGLISSLLWTGLLINSARANSDRPYPTQLALQEPIIRRGGDAEERQIEFNQEQQEIRQQRQFKQQLRNLEHEQRLRNFDLQIEVDQIQQQQRQIRQNQVRQRIQHQRQLRQDSLNRRRIGSPYLNRF